MLLRILLILVYLIIINSININDYKLKGTSKIFQDFTSFILNSQEEILRTLENEENQQVTFDRDYWHKKNDDGTLSSYGLTSCLQDGMLLEKGAASTTIVSGILSKERAEAISARDQQSSGIEAGCRYYAAAQSLVLHSKSPLLPTFRSDVRYFEIEKKNNERFGWFGGGTVKYIINNTHNSH